MAIGEMKMQLVASEQCFNALSPESCFEHLINDAPSVDHLFSVLAEKLCKTVMNPIEQTWMASKGPLNLFGLVSGML